MTSRKLNDRQNSLKGEVQIGTGYYQDDNGIGHLKHVFQKKRNTVVIGGTQWELEKLFNIRGSAGNVIPPILPYGLDYNGIASPIPPTDIFPVEHHIYAFMCGNGGTGLQSFDRPLTVDYREYQLMSPLPFLYGTSNPDIPDPTIRRYFGAVNTTVNGTPTMAYYTKRFSQTPVIHHIWKNSLTSSQLDEVDNSVWTDTTPQGIVTFVEIHLRVEPTDFMDYFSDPAHTSESPMINEIGLVSAMYDDQLGTSVGAHDYKWHRLFTRLTFKTIFLDVDSPVGVDFIYRLYNKI